MTKKFKLSKEQSALFDLIESTREHIFITGRAGTGKSTLLNYLTENTSKQVAVCAPTGVAALNVQGTTIHSLFFLPIGVIGTQRLTHSPQKRKVLQAIDTLIIDEISMVNADVLDGIDRTLREVRHKRHEAFGGVQVIMFGDPYQLAPVPPRSAEEKAYFSDHYDSIWFFDAMVWRDAPLRIVEMTEIHRQHDDDFKAMLNAVRHGNVTPEIGRALNVAGERPVPTGDIITLATTNDRVNRINSAALAQLGGELKKAEANIDGEFPSGWFPADESLSLKVGAQVMFLRNDSEQRWVNGTVGQVTRIGKTVHVDVDGEEHEVLPAVWERYRYDYDAETKTLTREVIAEFTQFPLRLAWAVTIHKSQGQTYNRAVIDLGSGAFAPGQTYVALSRITSLDGLYLTRGLRPSDIKVDADVQRFMAAALIGDTDE
jgi:ATP-dependent exoDNAse (exonuclease V) alpha subunit